MRNQAERRGGFARNLAALAFGALAYAGAPSIVTAAPRIGATELLSQRWAGGVIDNSAFTPGAGAAPALSPFIGTLRLSEADLGAMPADFAPAAVMGRNPRRFPGVELSFFTDHGDLVPFDQGVIRFGSSHAGQSYWDVLVQPGRVWSEPDDAGWSRAAFPLALVNSIEGETHNGLATFLYKRGQVSNLRFQIVQQTSPYYITKDFVAAGLVPASFANAKTDRLATLRRAYELQRADSVPMTAWSELTRKVGSEALAGFDSPLRPEARVLSGLDYQGVFYLKGCASAGGPLPWCDRARFGVWSATKVLANETALLRLAEKFGPSVFGLKIADYVPEAARFEGWRGVTFENAIDMATGIGNGSTKRQPNNASDGYLDPTYSRWYEARSAREKVAALLKDGARYPWDPGQVIRYRDQDMFVLGVAMDHFLKSKEGPTADLWSMLEREVFAPIGIHEAPTNRTIEADGSRGQPLMAYGYYPTISDIVLIARLYQNGGRHGGRQNLFAPRVRQLLAGDHAQGLPTGEQLPDGETTYINAFWVTSYSPTKECRRFYPRMIGWGGNVVALLPGGATGLRLAKSHETEDASEVDTAGMARVANALSAFCR